jgi:hypothetical protein
VRQTARLVNFAVNLSAQFAKNITPIANVLARLSKMNTNTKKEKENYGQDESRMAVPVMRWIGERIKQVEEIR